LSVPTGYLLDTNLISETRKLRAHAGVMAFLAAADSAGLFLSVLTLGELRKGVEAKRRNDATTAARLDAWVDDIETTFADRVLPVDVAAARLWGELSVRRSLPGDRYADRSNRDHPWPHIGDAQYPLCRRNRRAAA
jgi:toxin FitB